jgi:hypothetical protein
MKTLLVDLRLPEHAKEARENEPKGVFHEFSPDEPILRQDWHSRATATANLLV